LELPLDGSKGNRVKMQKTAIDFRRATRLLYPLAAFLRAGGLSEQEAKACFAAAFQKALKTPSARRFDHIGHPTRYADIVARWARDERFLDRSGRPRLLSLGGKYGFRALVREASENSDPEAVLAVFLRYGNVRKTKAGLYDLVRPFFFSSREKSMAFEPMAYFLSDASTTLGRILRRTTRARYPEVFWRKVETDHLSDVHAERFIEFLRDRSLTFLEEVDDWLEAHRTSRKRRRRNLVRRTGLGLFTIYSDPESPEVRR
jgi:hypothetical protein